MHIKNTQTKDKALKKYACVCATRQAKEKPLKHTNDPQWFKNGEPQTQQPANSNLHHLLGFTWFALPSLPFCPLSIQLDIRYSKQFSSWGSFNFQPFLFSMHAHIKKAARQTHLLTQYLVVFLLRFDKATQLIKTRREKPDSFISQFIYAQSKHFC